MINLGNVLTSYLFMTFELNIKGMSCNHCVNTVASIIKDVDGIVDAEVKLDEQKAVVNSNKDNRKEVINAVNQSGIYEAN